MSEYLFFYSEETSRFEIEASKQMKLSEGKITVQDFIKAKEMLVRSFDNSNYNNNVNLAIAQDNPTPIGYPSSLLSCAKVECMKVNPCKKKEQTMYDEDMDMDYDDNKLMYLRSRLNTIRYKRDEQLNKLYGLQDDDRPNTFEDFLARITAGKYTVNEKDRTRMCYSPAEYIRWRDPSVKEDHAGYKKAHEALTAASTETMDTITVMSDDATRLTAIRDFEKTAATIQ